jgi:transcriptional regulator with XRE-family HTH domain
MFNERLNQIRKSKGFTAQQIADLLHINIRSYRAYESADRSPNIQTLIQIADILEVSTDYLLCRDDFLKSHAISFGER